MTTTITPARPPQVNLDTARVRARAVRNSDLDVTSPTRLAFMIALLALAALCDWLVGFREGNGAAYAAAALLFVAAALALLALTRRERRGAAREVLTKLGVTI